MLADGIASDFDGEVSFKEVDANKVKISIKKGTKILKIQFIADVLPENSKGKVTLLNETMDVLAEADVTNDSVSTFDPGLTTPVAFSETSSAISPTSSLIPATPEEIAQRNEEANLRVGFNPLVNVKTVGTWTEFSAAYNDQTVTKIIMTTDLQRASTLTARQTSIEIDGGGFILDMTGDTLRLAATPSDGIGFFHFHDMTAKNSANEGNGTGGNMWAFVNAIYGTTYSRNWRFRTGNIETVRVNGQRVIRLIRGSRAEITVYGKMNLITTSENFYAGSIIVEDGTDWYGEDTGSDYSVIWFELESSGTDTGAAEQFIVGKNARVVLKNSTTGTAYPAVYHHWREFVLGEGSTYNSNMMGNAFRTSYTSTINLKKDSTMNLISRGTGAVLQFGGGYGFSNTTGTRFNVEQEASLYIVGDTAGPTIDFHTTTTARDIKLILTSPKGFDFRNKNNSNQVMNVRQTQNEFQVIDSDIDLWNKGVPILGPSNETYARVGNLSVVGTGGTANVNTTEPGLENFTPANYRRIAGMNSKPLSEWVPVTDADYTYKVRVLIGYTPGDEYDENSNVILEPVYASENQAKVTFTDTYGDTHEVWTDANGYASFTDTRFNTAGEKMTAYATRGPWVEETVQETTVIDVTPPEPASLVEGKVTNATKQLTAENLEPNAKVFLTITGTSSNAGTLVPAGTVAADGTWSHNLSSYLNAGDSVTIYLQDSAGAAPADIVPAPPTTNSADGNINPYLSDLSYRDATFKKATNYIVTDIIPDAPKLSKYSASSGGATTSIGDEVTYTLTAKNDKADSVDWTGVVLEDVLAAGLDFDSTDHGITIKQIDASGTETTVPLAADTFTYNETTRLLSIKLGDIPAKYSYVVTFKVTVASDATVDQDILNQATAKGYSPQESADPFVPGPITGPFKVIDVLSNEVGLPGGTLYGILQLTSAPDVIDFKKHALTVNDTRMNDPELSAPLTVSDSRGNRTSWTLTAKLTGVMANTDDSTKILADAIKFNNGTTEEALTASEITIKTHTHAAAGDYVVSDDWSANGAGLKLEVPAGGVPKLGKYQAEITWILGDTPTP
ncbi:pectate lyase-like adhesive domain-containing protein [uncultured Enterococcus sp.]|uniref:pectate lyase-like adhesive domain-containing protein n=1 Tax=uncultured Enterococcus sp. TaxID=167972 RepID=UPI002AA67650|nr:pectate lyase-like adhesive domain-containing protein [uncultured Enterococcus sp.]